MILPQNKKAILLLINTIGIVLILLFLLFKTSFSTPEIVYVDNIKLFDGFNMTKEMKKVGESQFNTQKAKIDSLYTEIQKSTPEKQKVLMQEYVGLKNQVEEFNQNFAYTESEKIWKRLESYVNDFSNEHSYKLIIGSEKKQDVLFASEKYDITNELIQYVNQKYEGAK